MVSPSQFGSDHGLDGISKLETNVDALSREAQARVPAALEERQRRARQAALLEQQMGSPATINSLQIHGAKNTRKTFLAPIFDPLVSPENNAGTTLGDVLARLHEATNKLDRFEIFKPEPRVYLSSARDSDPLAAATDLDVDIRVAERGRWMLNTGTDLGNAEGSAYGNLLCRNLFGGAESLSLNAKAGTRTRSAYTAAFSTPINGDPDLRFSLEGLASATEKPWANHEEVLRGGTARLAWRDPRTTNAHTLSLGSNWRQLTGLAGGASASVRADAGDSVKTALTHTFTRDRRDRPVLAQSGYLMRITSELAGWGPLGGDVSFAKTELELAATQPLPLPGIPAAKTGISVGAGLRFGLLCPLPLGFPSRGKAAPALAAPSRINDRFLLGGPTDVRGFKMGGLGPRDGADALGGDVLAAGGVHMLLPLPRAGAESPLRLQLFANGGRLVGIKNKGGKAKEAGAGAGMSQGAVVRGLQSAVAEVFNGLPSLAAGVGLVYAHPVARFELNFSLPLVMRRGEEGRKGLQVGVGINFL
ncbi:hypothetical protein RB594_003222 [Gaeumannomyces avenae]